MNLEFTSHVDREDKLHTRVVIDDSREQACQTKVDWELWEEMLDAHNIYRELIQHDDITDIRR